MFLIARGLFWFVGWHVPAIGVGLVAAGAAAGYLAGGAGKERSINDNGDVDWNEMLEMAREGPRAYMARQRREREAAATVP